MNIHSNYGKKVNHILRQIKSLFYSCKGECQRLEESCEVCSFLSKNLSVYIFSYDNGLYYCQIDAVINGIEEHVFVASMTHEWQLIGYRLRKRRLWLWMKELEQLAAP